MGKTFRGKDFTVKMLPQNAAVLWQQKVTNFSASWRSYKNRKSRHYPEFKDDQDQVISERQK